MNTKIQWAFLGLLISTLAWTGCAKCPCSSSDTTPSDVLDFLELSKSFWKVDTASGSTELPPIGESGTRRLAIVEFSIEYLPGDDGAQFGTGLKLALPDVLHDGFIGILPEFNREAVPMATLSESETFQKLEGGKSTDAELMSGDGSGVLYPTTGLVAVDDAQPELQENLGKILEEVEADTVVRVHLKVSVRDGRASIEKGSAFRAIAKEGSQRLDSQMSLVSPQKVLGEGGAISSSRYAKAVKGLFRSYIAMALIAGDAPLE